MPAFELENESGVVDNVNPNDKPAPYQTTAVDNAYNPVRSLLTHVEGAKWVLDDYFSQYLGMDQAVDQQNVNAVAVYQQYLQIKDFEMRVNQPLDISSDTSSREFQLVGSATTYPGFIPNKGDMFVAMIGDGRKMLFTLTDIEKKTMLLDSVYEVSYESVDYLSPDLEEDLLSKVVKKVTFVKEFMALGNSPFLVDSEYSTLKELREWVHKLPLEYVREFFNEEFSTFLIPAQEKTTYDPFIVKFAKATMSTHMEPLWSRVREHNCDNGEDSGYITILDTLLESNERGLDFVQQFFEIFFIRGQHRNTTFGTITYSGIDNVYYPKDNKSLGYVNEQVTFNPSPARVFNRPIDLSIVISDTTLEGLTAPDMISVNSIHPVTVDDYYILSKAFYESDTANMSALELLLHTTYYSKPICHFTLLNLCKKSVYWGVLERFYYLPLLQFLLVVSKKDVN